MASPIPDKLIQTLVVPNCGALFLAVPFASLVYGITVLQTYRYYSHYADDPLYVKIFVAVIAFFDTAQLAFVIYSAWWYLIPNYGNLASISVIPFGISAEIAMTIALGILVQCFFASRVWLMSGRKLIIPLIIIAFSLGQFAFGIYYAVRIQRSQSVLIFPQLAWSAAVGLACSMASDFAITGSQCYYLRKVRSGMTKTDKLIDVLIMYTVNTGLITSVVATSAIVLSTVFSTTFWLVIPFTLISKSYANSALATLNARHKLRNMSTGSITMNSERAEFTTNISLRIRETMARRRDSVVSEVRFTGALNSILEDMHDFKPFEGLPAEC